ncbi:VWA domain-containing protein [Pseudoalteromonas haloplanktis]|uniref:VWA domain-containing protein n=1 Tax=Pseudoalteromonas haloplanktis TaxID=228 RepID=A0ABU1BFD6_PSEHA|nr:VWA domain-containing protein [Pseudoalteromonas haloplanktis]MDQ9093184.1 VWA domain-containing protein [Pseudoalteromonas haloplanktis]
MIDFHFLRPWVLLLLPIAIFCYWLLRRRNQEPKQAQAVVAPHLVKALTPEQRLVDKVKPVDLVAVLAIFVIFAASGPAWYKQPPSNSNPPIAIVLKVTDAMLANDLAPNRLQRAKQKINDLLTYRSPAKTTLIAYAQTTHKVLPLTEDHQVFAPFVDALSPDVMPGSGTFTADDVADAVAMAQQELVSQGGGTIVVLADDFSRIQVEKLNTQATPFVWWQFATKTGGVIIDEKSNHVLDSADGSALLIPNAATLGALNDVEHVNVTVNNSDLLAIDAFSQQNRQAQLANDTHVPYADMAWYFTWPALLLCALWFRKGWTSSKQVQLSSIVIMFSMSVLLSAPNTAQASVKDWFLTADQQGMLAYNKNNFEQAANLFNDPYWRARSLYEMGKYIEAAQIFSTFGTADGFYNRGNALLKSQDYLGAINAYKYALKIDPEHQQAQQNLVLAEKALELVLAMDGNVDMEQSVMLDVDGDKMSEKADGKGQDYQVGGDLDENSKEAWMRSVDSQMSDFLSAKFNNEVNKQERQK